MTGVVVPNIEAPGAYDEAVKGVDGIIHAASPVIFSWNDPSEVIDPAVNGAIGILTSALKYGKDVKRVVLTSSKVAIVMENELEEDTDGKVYDEVKYYAERFDLRKSDAPLRLTGILRRRESSRKRGRSRPHLLCTPRPRL